MRPTRVHARIFQHPFAQLLQGARLDSFELRGDEVVLDLLGFQQTSSQIFERRGRLVEKATGSTIPMRLCFSEVSELQYSAFFTELEKYPLEDESRIIMGLYSWLQPGKENVFYVFFLQDPVATNILFFAKRVECQIGKGEIPFRYERNWSSTPLMPAGLVPRPAHLHKRFGGDPITIKVNGQVFQRRLFIGGTDIQPTERPHVDAVVNLGETPSRWLNGNDIPAHDRAINKGEGANGMSVGEIQEEADWIIDRLKKDQRVLVHCAAGMNRSATICCAVLMLLEELSAEKALERVREHHPWARPDSHHWLALRWLDKNRKE
jgi:hypothetical protein